VELDLLNSDLNKLLISAGSNAAIFSCFFAAILNRYWSGFTGRILICIHFALIFTMWALRANESWQQNVLYLFADANKAPISWLFFLAVVGCMGQLSFILMLASRSQRYAQIKQRREERIRARSSSLSVENREISRLLDEQRRLLETLTHEVRQPINNAQAALQNIMSDLRPEDGNQKNVRPIAKRIQKILDGITLSLSNAIVGATLIERRKAAELRDCDIVSIAQFALLDTPDNVRERIVVDFPAHDLVLPVDPILIRLALRNLLDNAAKFSPPGSAIKFSIALDETRFGVLISVSNCVPNSFAFEPYMLERGKRGHNDTTAKDGSGIGLYIFSEIAKIHGNEIVIEYAEPGKVTFGMLLSE
jgi:signal transduction histidine kinase